MSAYNMTIKIIPDDGTGLYSVDVNGMTVLECLAKHEVDALTLSELVKLSEAEI